MSSIVFSYAFNMLSLGRIVISDLVTDLFMHSFSGMILQGRILGGLGGLKIPSNLCLILK